MKMDLRKMRIECGLSQYELAFASGVPRYVIQLTESLLRLPNPEHQKKIAETLGIKVDELFDNQSNKSE